MKYSIAAAMFAAVLEASQAESYQYMAEQMGVSKEYSSGEGHCDVEGWKEVKHLDTPEY